ncbi:hypothetical protein OH492_14145 [Vibrio chagasii]|nr:hypothetical protein [Vibrio chagasii]
MLQDVLPVLEVIGAEALRSEQQTASQKQVLKAKYHSLEPKGWHEKVTTYFAELTCRF